MPSIINATTTTGVTINGDNSGNLAIQTNNGNTAVTIDTSQKVGIGTSSPQEKLSLEGSGSQYMRVKTTTTNADIYFGITSSSLGYVGTGGSDPLTFLTGGTERMRIDSSGKLLVGTTSLSNSNDSGGVFWSSATGSGGEGGFEFRNTSTSANSDANPTLVIIKGSTTYTSSQRFIQFNANAGSQAMGGIVGNGATNVQFVSLSDVREKENIEPITGSLNKVVALNPVEFDWKQTGEHITAGFIAQEVESLFPEYVVDNVANAGEEERKGLTGGMSAGFIAHLVSSIKELNAKVEAQAVRIAELEGAR